MAYTSGTAANYKDLLAVLATFAAANGWVILEQSETLIYMKGTGLAGLDEIYCGIGTYEVPTSGIYNWNLYGSLGYRSGRAVNSHPGNSYRNGSSIVVACLWNAAIQYWMVANGRRIIVVAKVGTVYISIHLGLLTPLATDAQYPYPLLIASVSGTNTHSYSSTSIYNFWAGPSVYIGCGRLMLPGGVWGKFGTTATGSTEVSPNLMCYEICQDQIGAILDAPDGSYLLTPIYVVRYTAPYSDIFGHVDGLFRVTGYNNTSENIITVGGVNYFVFQDCGRNAFKDFCCMRMN